jgi:ankyrin repeat protein
MEIKCNRLEWRSVLVAGLFLNYGAVLEASIPCFSEWNDRTKLDSRIAIGTSVASIDKMGDLINSYLAGKTYNPNQKVMIGYYLPVIFYAACLPNPTTGDHLLKKILEDNMTVVAVETALGDTPMHAAAINSSAALELLIADERLDINEHNNSGKTPIYVAMECNNGNSHSAAINLLKGTSRFLINSRDNRGRTMLHIAVAEGNQNVVTQIFALEDKGGNPLDANIKDDLGQTAADYLEDIDNVATRVAIQNALDSNNAIYGMAGNHITSYTQGTGACEYAAHAADVAVPEVNISS